MENPVNIHETNGDSLTVVLPELFALREKHGPDSAVGHHASNIAELVQLPNPPAFQLKRQMDGLQRAMRDVQ